MALGPMHLPHFQTCTSQKCWRRSGEAYCVVQRMATCHDQLLFAALYQELLMWAVLLVGLL